MYVFISITIRMNEEEWSGVENVCMKKKRKKKRMPLQYHPCRQNLNLNREGERVREESLPVCRKHNSKCLFVSLCEIFYRNVVEFRKNALTIPLLLQPKLNPNLPFLTAHDLHFICFELDR